MSRAQGLSRRFYGGGGYTFNRISPIMGDASSRVLVLT